MKLPVAEIIRTIGTVASVIGGLLKSKPSATLDPELDKLTSEKILEQALERARQRAKR